MNINDSNERAFSSSQNLLELRKSAQRNQRSNTFSSNEINDNKKKMFVRVSSSGSLSNDGKDKDNIIINPQITTSN